MSSKASTALIVGAGVGGLAAGIGLQRAGWHVRVFERAAHARELGFALLLAPNALVSLEHLGVADRVIAAGSEMTFGEICGTAGRVLRRFDLTSLRELLPQPALVVLRPALHGVLLDAFGPQHVSVDSEATGVSFDRSMPALRPISSLGVRRRLNSAVRCALAAEQQINVEPRFSSTTSATDADTARALFHDTLQRAWRRAVADHGHARPEG